MFCTELHPVREPSAMRKNGRAGMLYAIPIGFPFPPILAVSCFRCQSLCLAGLASRSVKSSEIMPCRLVPKPFIRIDVCSRANALPVTAQKEIAKNIKSLINIVFVAPVLTHTFYQTSPLSDFILFGDRGARRNSAVKSPAIVLRKCSSSSTMSRVRPSMIPTPL